MSKFLQRVEDEIQSHHLLLRGQKVLVAVSGGVDSMVLLHILHSLALKYRWKILVAHFNHRLRGRASDMDEGLVHKTAAAMKLQVVAGSVDVKSFAVKSKLSLEMAARKLRHEFLARTARKHRIKTIALAHHAGDQVELFFIRLLRGAGGEGLSGMKWKSPSPADRTISIIRPLLDSSKEELQTFARENKIRFRDDATNFSTDFLRNRIRNELLPLLRRSYQPGLDKAVLRLMEIVGAEVDVIAEKAQQWLKQRKSIFEGLPVAIQRRVLLSQLAGLGVPADFDLIESLRQSADCFVSVGAKMCVCRDKSGEIRLRTDSKPEFDASELPVDLSVTAGETIFGTLKLNWDTQIGAIPVGRGYRRAGSRGRSPHQIQKEFFDADKVGDEIILRHWRPGDRFQPIGLKSAAKLQDLFTNAKISTARRRNLVLAQAADGKIFWVEGLRIGERFKLTPQTKRKLVWNWSNLAV